MSMGNEIATLFASNSLGVVGASIFVNRMPETPDICCAIFETGGTAPQGGFSVPGILHERPGAQIRFRGEKRDSDGPRAQAQSAYRLCMTIQAMLLSGTKYLTLQPTQAPFILERDGNERVVWVFNVLAEKELSAT